MVLLPCLPRTEGDTHHFIFHLAEMVLGYHFWKHQMLPEWAKGKSNKIQTNQVSPEIASNFQKIRLSYTTQILVG